ncbi:Multidrug efflux pump subunit AcrA (membrane-fusion protein) [Enhydrobacter aerosaccus]|uniref:Multidrug efflux pump subunit AcrA (Membrane-fusion protein) n=1 Tax=Enhydrobacter aerosaccus TaxID=225324 RepID=A0A1T4SBF6_9HYPH|nr:multidrug transporter [Enhydrobacter aerosaccus]SKA25553.1 Multidrug efflux pump subunit AcrA (membrane-fusion protein) [Enhydrobacter aerosaccus]
MTQPRSSTGSGLPWVVAAVLIALGLAALLAWGFIRGRGQATTEARSEQPVKPSVEVSSAKIGPPTITLGPDLQQQADIRVEPATPSAYQKHIQAYGSVVDLQPFTELSNANASAKAQLAIAQARLAASQSAFERAQLLYKNGQNFSIAQLQAAEAAYKSDAASVGAAQIRTRNAAASAYQAWGPVLGQSLTDGTDLAQDLIQHRKVLVQVTLPLGVALPQPPPSASIETSTGQRVSIDFASAATRTDPRIQGVSFFYTADGSSGALPGMNVVALLPAGRPAPGIAVPAAAVVWLQGRAWVYVQSSPNSFTRREISTSLPQPGGGYVVPAITGGSARATSEKGLSANQALVVSGAQVLLSQEFSAQIRDLGD